MFIYVQIIFFALFVIQSKHLVDGLGFSLLSHLTRPTFTNETKSALRDFAPLQDLRDLQLCHILPFDAIDKKLALTFLDQWDKLKSGKKVKEAVFNDLKLDAYKVDSEAAYLKTADVKSKMNLYHENANQRRALEEEFSKLSLEENPRTSTYSTMVQNILNLFYNAPANLRVSSQPCINEGPAMSFEDPNLRSYTETPHRSLNDTEFTEHSRYLARKYRLSVMRDRNGAIRTTDKKKSELDPALPDSLREYNKGLNVFQFFSKNKKNAEITRKSKTIQAIRKRGKVTKIVDQIH